MILFFIQKKKKRERTRIISDMIFLDFNAIILNGRWLCNMSKTSASVSSGFQTPRNRWKHEAAGRVLLLFWGVWNPWWNTKHEFLTWLLKLVWEFRACLHGGGGPQVGEVTCDGSSHLSCKRDQIKMTDYMNRRVTQPKRVTSPTWGPPTPYKQALSGIISEE